MVAAPAQAGGAGAGGAAGVCVVVANVHVAQQGQQVHGLPFGAWYYWVRPLLQPVSILSALYCSGVWVGLVREAVAAGGGEGR